VVSDYIVKMDVMQYLEYCSQTLDIHGQRVLQLILFLVIVDFIIIGNMGLNMFCSRRAYNIENMVDIKNLKNFIVGQFVNFKYTI
jgi:hypothetical protein